MTGEFDLIERIRQRAGSDASVLLGIGDDAAVLQPTAGQALVATTDTLVEGRHFLSSWSPADIGHLALAVNLSDLAAMAARPRWLLLSLTLPAADPDWLDGLLDGFLALADRFGAVLVGGNLSSGPLSITVQALGEAEPGRLLRRGQARAGHCLAVTGVPGEAAAALALGEAAPPALLARLKRPQPRVEIALELAPWLSSAADVSDGLLADLAHLLGQGQGAVIRLADLPVSDALMAALPEPESRWPRQLSGGSDYELVMSLAPDQVNQVADVCRAAGLAWTVIGEVTDSGRIDCIAPDGQAIPVNRSGWDHFPTLSADQSESDQ
ncbi:MAG: thiamine-phosphate kinase [Wenzhouxiangella sp.]